MKYFITFMLCYCLIETRLAENSENNASSLLTPKEPPKAELKLPAGLHISLDLSTGEDEVKINDVEENEKREMKTKKPITNAHKENTLAAVVDNNNNNNETLPESLPDHLKLNVQTKSFAIGYTPDDNMDKVRQKYKSYKELKRTYDSMRKDFQTDAEIILQLLEKFKNITKKSKGNAQVRNNLQMKILYNLNYLISQFDNALLFADKGGLEHVLLPIIVNSTDVGVRVEAMRVLASLTQNNAQVQIKVFERNFGPYLIQILLSSTNTEELSTALAALGSLLRKFPYAQLKLLPTSGIQALVALLAKDCEMKIKAKVATIISDMVVEKHLMLTVDVGNEEPLAATQYESLDYPKWLEAHSYCDTMDILISNNVHHFWDAPDLMEYFIHCIDNTRTICATFWSQNAQFRQNLLTLQNHYLVVNDEYHVEVSELIRNVVDRLYGGKSSIKHDEF